MTFRIFVAFDVDHDQDLCDEILASGGSQRAFEVSGRSERGATGAAWERRAEGQISRADQFVVVCGEHTDESERVATELRIAREQEKPVVLLWSRREAMCKQPAGPALTETMFSGTPEILRDQLVANQRKALPTRVPDRLKKQGPSSSDPRG